MPSRFDIKVRDILTLTNFLGIKRKNFLKYIRPLDRNLFVNTIFKWNSDTSTIHLSGSWDFWKKKTFLKKSENEFNIIIPLSPGLFRYEFTFDKNKKTIENSNKKNNFKKKLSFLKKVKRLDKEIISSESLLNDEMKTNSYFRKCSNLDFNLNNKNPQYIPSYLLTAFYNDKIMNEKLFRPSKLRNDDIRKTIFFNHLALNKNFFFKGNFRIKILVTKVKIKEKLCTFFYFIPKNFNLKNKFHPIKALFLYWNKTKFDFKTG
jgi:hypothetical protein